MKKKIYVGVAMTIALVLISGIIYFIFTYESDKEILNGFDDEINALETEITDDEATDKEVEENISEDITVDDESLDELEVSLDSVLDSLKEIESAEDSLGTTVE